MECQAPSSAAVPCVIVRCPRRATAYAFKYKAVGDSLSLSTPSLQLRKQAENYRTTLFSVRSPRFAVNVPQEQEKCSTETQCYISALQLPAEPQGIQCFWLAFESLAVVTGLRRNYIYLHYQYVEKRASHPPMCEGLEERSPLTKQAANRSQYLGVEHALCQLRAGLPAERQGNSRAAPTPMPLPASRKLASLGIMAVRSRPMHPTWLPHSPA